MLTQLRTNIYIRIVLGVLCNICLQPSEQQHCAWINRTLEILRKCVNVHWLWGPHELGFLRWSRGVVFSPFRHRLRRLDILHIYISTNSPISRFVENETKDFCFPDSTMHLKTPLKSPADGWGAEADFRNPFLRSPESQYYNANVPRHLRWRGGLST